MTDTSTETEVEQLTREQLRAVREKIGLDPDGAPSLGRGGDE